MARTMGKPVDTVSDTSLFGMIKRVLEGKGAMTSLPSGAGGEELAATTTTWEHGSYVELDDGTGVTADSALIGYSVDTPSAAMIGEVIIATGAEGSEVAVATIPLGEIATDAGGYQPAYIPPCGKIAAGTRVAASLATAGATAHTINAKAIIKPV